MAESIGIFSVATVLCSFAVLIASILLLRRDRRKMEEAYRRLCDLNFRPGTHKTPGADFAQKSKEKPVLQGNLLSKIAAVSIQYIGNSPRIKKSDATT